MTNPVPNGQPTLALSEFVQLQGIYPTRDPNTGSYGSFIGQIAWFAGASNYFTGPASGQLLSISQNTALFSLLGTNYGGNGVSNFALPNLNGTVAIGYDTLGFGEQPIGPGQTLGESGNAISRPQTPTAIGGSYQPVDAYQPSLGVTYLINTVGSYPGSGGMKLDALGLVTASADGFVQAGEMVCDGSLLNIADFSVLFSLIGATYGGDGITTFALPDLRGRDIVGTGSLSGSSYLLGQTLGSSTYTIQNNNLPLTSDQPIADRQPGLVMNYLIALTGIFPSRDTGAVGFDAEPVLGEVVASASNVLPNGWALCNGQLLSITQNQPLFAILGTTYGGDGIRTFALPNLQGRTIVGAAGGVLGHTAGATSLTLNASELPSPSVSTIAINGLATNRSSSETFTVTFSDAVISAIASNFAAVTTGSVTAGAITVNPVLATAGLTFVGQTSYRQYTVTVAGVSGTGTLGLAVSGAIRDASGNSVSGIGSSASYTIVPPPSITGTATTSTVSETPFKPFSGLTLSDGSTGATDTLTITYNGGALGGSSSAYVVTGTPAVLTTVLDALTYGPAAAAGPDAVATTTFTLTLKNTSDASSATRTIVVTDTAAPSVPSSALLANDTGVANDGRTSDPTILYPTLSNGDTLLYSTDGAAYSATAPVFATNGTQDGVHTIALEAKNAAGAVSGASGVLTFTLDTTPPALPSLPMLLVGQDTGVSASDGITSVNTPTFTGTAEAGATVALFRDGGVSLGTTTAALDGSYAIAAVTPLADGRHTIFATATDAAGNRLHNTAAVSYVTIETSVGAPSAPTLALGSDTGVVGDGITAVKTPTVTGTATAGATVTLYDTDGTTVLGTTHAAADGTYQVVSSMLVDGAHTLTAMASDFAGNVSARSTATTLTINTALPAQSSAPTPPAGLSNDGATSNNQPTFTGTASVGTTVVLYRDNGTAIGSDTVGVSGTYAITPSPLPDGRHLLYTLSFDAAGNRSSGLAGVIYITVQTTLPAATAPVLSAGSDTGASSSDGITAQKVPSLTGTTTPGATVRLYDTDGTTVLGTGTAAANGAYTVTASALAEGGHTLTVIATDQSGNVGPRSAATAIVIDTTAPGAPTPTLSAASDTGVVGDRLTRLATPTLTGTAEAGASVALYRDNGIFVGAATAAPDGSYSITPSSPLSDGQHLVYGLATDLAGNRSAPGFSYITIDTAVPVPTVAGNGTTVTQAAQTITGTGKPYSSVMLSDNAVAAGTTTVGGDGMWQQALTLSSGTNTLVATDTDLAGNVGTSQPAMITLTASLHSLVQAMATTTAASSPLTPSAPPPTTETHLASPIA